MIPREKLLTMFDDDKTLLILGGKGTGKTNTAGVLCEPLVEDLNYKVWTNIHFFEEKNIGEAIKNGLLTKPPTGFEYVPVHPNITMVTRLSQTLLDIVDHGRYRKLFILDEAGIHASSSRGTSADTNTIKDLNKIIRHFSCAFGLISQVDTMLPPDIREGDSDYHLKMEKRRDGRVMLIKKKKVKIDDDGKEKIDFPVVKRYRMPLCKYPIDGKFPTGFHIDIDLKHTLDLLSEVGDSIELMARGKGRKIIEELLAEQQKMMEYVSTGEYARMHGISPQTVRRMIYSGELDAITLPSGRYRVKMDEW